LLYNFFEINCIILCILFVWWKNKPCKNFKVLKFWKKGLQQKIHFFNYLTKKLCLMGSKCLALGPVTCVRNNLDKKHVWLSIETHFEIFWDFCIFGCKPFNIHTQLCMNVKTHHHHMNYFKLKYSIFPTKLFFK
jgi:hypothetical protein